MDYSKLNISQLEAIKKIKEAQQELAENEWFEVVEEIGRRKGRKYAEQLQNHFRNLSEDTAGEFWKDEREATINRLQNDRD